MKIFCWIIKFKLNIKYVELSITVLLIHDRLCSSFCSSVVLSVCFYPKSILKSFKLLQTIQIDKWFNTNKY